MTKAIRFITALCVVILVPSCTKTDPDADKFEPMLFNITEVSVTPYPNQKEGLFAWYGEIPQEGVAFDIFPLGLPDGAAFFPCMRINGEFVTLMGKDLEEVFRNKETTEIIEGEWGNVVYNFDTDPYSFRFFIESNESSSPRVIEISMTYLLTCTQITLTQTGKPGEQ